MSQDKLQSKYGSLDQTNQSSVGPAAAPPATDHSEIVDGSGGGGIAPTGPPAPALRRKTLDKRLATRNNHDQNGKQQAIITLENTTTQAPSQQQSSNNNNFIEQQSTTSENNNRRSHIAPPNLSMSQLRQQQAINKELAERHKSLKRTSQINNEQQQQRTNQGFQNAAFQDDPREGEQQNVPMQNVEKSDNDQRNTSTTNQLQNDQAGTRLDDNFGINGKNLDGNLLSMLIKPDHHQQNSTTASKNNSSTGGKNVLIDNLTAARKGLNDVELDEELDEAEKELQEIDESQLRPYPRKVFCIVANEFCERFSYYGLRTVLVLYFKSVLGMSETQSTVNFHIFAALCYLTPIFGAILGDSVWGKYKTILYLSLVYFLGEFILVTSSIYWHAGSLSNWLTLIGLLLIGFGTGGIKPCVSAFGGDQFLPNETRRRASFFSMFYASINAGSLISMFATPMLRSDVHCVGRLDCYPLAFGLPCILMFMSIVCFLMAKNHYTYKELPERNVILAFSQCVWLALKRKLSGWKQIDIPEVHAQSTNASIMTQSQSSLDSTSTTTSGQQKLAILSNGLGKETVATEMSTRRPSDDSNSSNTSTNTNSSPTARRNARRRLRQSHWIYLARDQFDSKSLEDFRSVLGILFLFVPIPVYWCLYDQQGSLWTLQAARMDGRVFGSNFILQPDQVAVANPILLLATIPLFQCFIYPNLNRYNLLKSSISKITLGGFVAALTFAVSALIEFRIQAAMPPLAPPVGQASINLVNGLTNCRLIELELTHNYSTLDSNHSALSIPRIITINNKLSSIMHPVDDTSTIGDFRLQNQSGLAPLTGQIIPVESRLHPDLSNYQMRFRVASVSSTSVLSTNNWQQDDTFHYNDALNNDSVNKTVATATTTTPILPAIRPLCALDSSLRHELNVLPFEDRSRQLVYIEQGNGKLKYHVFNESWALPESNLARVVLLYESFGPLSSSSRRRFRLIPTNKLNEQQQATGNENLDDWQDRHTENSNIEQERDGNGATRGQNHKFGFRKYQFDQLEARIGSVYMYHWLDFEVPPRGLKFKLQTTMLEQHGNSSNNSADLINSNNNKNIKLKLIKLAPDGDGNQRFDDDVKSLIIEPMEESEIIHLKPGTRNMIIVHQATSERAYFRHSISQDNTYRVNILWQLIPYLMISMSEVLFSITGLEFSYSVAPDTMKSVILGAWFLTTAVGNILTVAVESIHPFTNAAYDFLFYAALMVIDMILFMYIGLNFKPYNRRNT